MNFLKIISLLIFSFVTFTVQAEDVEPLKIAVCGPFTGGSADFGKMIQRGTNLKLKEINAAGGVRGRPLELVFQDDEGKPGVAATVAQKVAADSSIAAVVGHFNSACSLAAKPIYRDRKIVAISPGSTNVNVCKGSDWFFRNLYRDDFQGVYVARYIKEVLGATRVAVIFDNDAYGSGLKQYFSEHAQKLGLQIVAEENYNRDATKDFNSIVSKLKFRRPEVVFCSGLYSEAGLIAAAMSRKGVNAKIIGGDGVFSPRFVEIGRQATEGAFIITPYVNDSSIGPLIDKFSKSFIKTYETEPDAWAALSYDALGTVVQVIEKVGHDRKAIRDELAQMDTQKKGYHGVTGITFFDSNGDCVKPAFVSEVSGGKLTLAKKQLAAE